ncbi:hypothetical protein ARMSODRAFT_738054 [Armillaria solidipes]|uniref:Uncharacterized protein n=1 Tax=Armillaria solidipes TaxID=1076256 RepID=A0A2H3AZ54_9AGAR|nr:hypothetical protein ARMSODRAFT_738054 [Armillaria solidipes]
MLYFPSAPTLHKRLIEVTMVNKARFRGGRGGLMWPRSMTERSSWSATLGMKRSTSVVGEQADHEEESGTRLVNTVWVEGVLVHEGKTTGEGKRIDTVFGSVLPSRPDLSSIS